MSLDKEPRWLPIAPWLFLFVWSAGYGVSKLAPESTTPLNLRALRFFGATVALLPFVLIFRPIWPGIVLAAVSVELVLYAPSKPANQQTKAP
jgi:drug/metabolite transporter (DMT)-like permease